MHIFNCLLTSYIVWQQLSVGRYDPDALVKFRSSITIWKNFECGIVVGI